MKINTQLQIVKNKIYYHANKIWILILSKL
jgi:hypothetical protein